MTLFSAEYLQEQLRQTTLQLAEAETRLAKVRTVRQYTALEVHALQTLGPGTPVMLASDVRAALAGMPDV